MKGGSRPVHLARECALRASAIPREEAARRGLQNAHASRKFGQRAVALKLSASFLDRFVASRGAARGMGEGQIEWKANFLVRG